MESMEDDLLAHSLACIEDAHQRQQPFLLRYNTTRMHVWTRLSERWKDKTGLVLYADGMPGNASGQYSAACSVIGSV